MMRVTNLFSVNKSVNTKLLPAFSGVSRSFVFSKAFQAFYCLTCNGAANNEVIYFKLADV